tara:strand:- start:130 stop:519 length:390 start_codon:yes stop_codon:yes gene_type:complete
MTNTVFIKFNNIQEARAFNNQFYRLFTQKDIKESVCLYEMFECLKGNGWIEIPTGSLFMVHKRRSNFKEIFDIIEPILAPIFTTPMSEVKLDMIDERRLDVNQLMRDNCTLRTRAYMYKNGHLEDDTLI